MKTILFFDEANTSDAISLIKEIVVDKSLHGKPLNFEGVEVIAACNPYRRYQNLLIQSQKTYQNFCTK